MFISHGLATLFLCNFNYHNLKMKIPDRTKQQKYMLVACIDEEAIHAYVKSCDGVKLFDSMSEKNRIKYASCVDSLTVFSARYTYLLFEQLLFLCRVAP